MAYASVPDDGKLYVDPGDRYLAFSMLLPPNWRAQAVPDNQPMIGLRPVSSPDSNVLMYVGALSQSNYGDGRHGLEIERSIVRDVAALQKDVPEKQRLKATALVDGGLRAYKHADLIHVVRKRPRELTYSAYMYDAKKGAVGVVTLIVSGRSKPLYASYVKDLKTIADSFTFIK